MKILLAMVALISIPHFGITQNDYHYSNAYSVLDASFENKINLHFWEAVFLTETAYFEGKLDSSKFNKRLEALVNLSEILKEGFVTKSSQDDNLNTYGAIFLTMIDTVTAVINDGMQIQHLPFRYEFDDIFGTNDWSNTFVSKLLITRKGNCHSLPFLYKMICERLNVPCHLALAPNHIYIKHRAEKGGWYNVELTSASFPIDAWLMASGYISLEAVQNGIYLDTLSEKESIALCVIDLAQGYNHKYPDNDGTFVIECCDLALKHFPDYVNAILLKAETRLKQLQAMQKDMKYAYLKEVTAIPDGKAKWEEMNSLYMQLYKFGYRQMPEQMYVEWLTSLKTEREKYSNKNAPGATKE